MQHLSNLHGVDFYRSHTGGRFCASPKVYIINEDIPDNFSEQCGYYTNHLEAHYSDIAMVAIVKKHSVQRTLSTCSSFYLHSSC